MAKLEIPSIVVQSGSHTPPKLDRNTRHTQWSLSTQRTYDDESEPVNLVISNEPSQEEEPVVKDEGAQPEASPSNNNNLNRTRSKGSLKLLHRSSALVESTSPPPEAFFSPVHTPTPPTSMEVPALTNNNNNNNSCSKNNDNNSMSSRPPLKNSDSNWSSTLSRGNSFDQSYNDQSGDDVEQFIIETMTKSTKDRMFILKIENELINFIKDARRRTIKYGPMTSYQRMIVHRTASYFLLEHNTETSIHTVTVSRGKNTRLPNTRFIDFIRDKPLLSEEPRRSILKRDSASFEEPLSFKSPDRHMAERSKSLEEREEQYEKVRRRIFCEEHGEQQDMPYPNEYDNTWSHVPNTSMWHSTDSNDSTKLHPNCHRPSRLTKVESYECKDTLKANSLRGSISKSFSFNGYDQNSQCNKVLTKQDSSSSMSSRLSPSSSGYKSQSQRSDATMSATPSPTATPNLSTQLSNQSGAMSPDPEQINRQDSSVMWAVSDLSSVPVGSVLINPQTAQPYTNEDGTVYTYNPDNPPIIESNAEGHQILKLQKQQYQRGKNNEHGGYQQRAALSTRSNEREVPAPAAVTSPVHNSQVGKIDQSECACALPVQAPAPVLHHLSMHNQHNFLPPPPVAVPQQPMTAARYPNGTIVHYSNAVPPHGHAQSPYGMAPMMMQQQPSEGHYSIPGLTGQHLMYGLPAANPPYSGIPPSYERPSAISERRKGKIGSGAKLGSSEFPEIKRKREILQMYKEGAPQDVCGYMMGLSLSDMGRPETSHRPVFYCPAAPNHAHATTHPSGHISQMQGTYPLFYSNNTQTMGLGQAVRYPPAGYPQYTAVASAERPAPPECNYPQPPMRACFPHCSAAAPVGGGPGYGSNNPAGNNMMGLVQLPPAPTTMQQVHQAPPGRHRLTPPNNPQSGCHPYQMYTNGYINTVQGGYPHYQTANATSQIQIPPILRPTLQINMCNSPPLRGARGPGFNNTARSPNLREPVPSESHLIASNPLCFNPAAPTAPIPFTYQFQYPTNELILFNNGRPPYNNPANNGRYPPPPINASRRQREKPVMKLA